MHASRSSLKQMHAIHPAHLNLCTLNRGCNQTLLMVYAKASFCRGIFSAKNGRTMEENRRNGDPRPIETSVIS